MDERRAPQGGASRGIYRNMTPFLAQRPRSERSFERLYQRHAGDVYRYCLAVMRHESDAEDVAQTTFMNAYRAYQRGERPRDARNWLITIAHNVCRQRFRQSQRRVKEVAYDDGVGGALVPEEEAPTAEDIRRALDQLAFNQRAALVMRELEGRSYAEIAELLELSVAAVETLLFRARRALREQLEADLTCAGAELAISRQLDRRLPRDERGQLRAHLRACSTCAALARKQRAQRVAIRTLGAVPLPASLASLFGGGSAAAAGTGTASALVVKTAAVVAAGAVTAGAGYELTREPPAASGRQPVPTLAVGPAATAAPTSAGAVTPRAAPAVGPGQPPHSRGSADAHPASRPGPAGPAAAASAAVSTSEADRAAPNARAASPPQRQGRGPGATPGRPERPAADARPQGKERAVPAQAQGKERTTPARPQGKERAARPQAQGKERTAPAQPQGKERAAPAQAQSGGRAAGAAPGRPASAPVKAAPVGAAPARPAPAPPAASAEPAAPAAGGGVAPARSAPAAPPKAVRPLEPPPGPAKEPAAASPQPHPVPPPKRLPAAPPPVAPDTGEADPAP